MAQVTHTPMEATGNFWMPVYNLLEGHFELIVTNAAHMKAVPGRKTDLEDAAWIAELLRHGLLKASFIPSRQQRDFSSTEMLEQLVAGKSDPKEFAQLAKRRLRAKIPQLEKALSGNLRAHHKLIIEQLLTDIAVFVAQIAELDLYIETLLRQEDDNINSTATRRFSLRKRFL